MAFVGAVNKALGNANIIAEDLGYLTPAVKRLLKSSGYPGMKVLEFAFDSREESDYMPHNYQNHCVVYTGTHDNDTVRGWFSTAGPEDVALALNIWGFRMIPTETGASSGPFGKRGRPGSRSHAGLSESRKRGAYQYTLDPGRQ